VKRVKQEGGIEFMTGFFDLTEISDSSNPSYYLKQKNKTMTMSNLDVSEGVGIGTHYFE